MLLGGLMMRKGLRNTLRYSLSHPFYTGIKDNLPFHINVNCGRVLSPSG